MRSVVRGARLKAASWVAGQNVRASYEGASTSRLWSNWFASLLSPDAEQKGTRRDLRARARELVRNNEWASGFVSEVVNNVIGPDGIQLQAKIRSGRDGLLNKSVNFAIEDAWKEWGTPTETCFNGRDGFVDVEDLAIRTLATDGEVFIRTAKGFPNTFGYAIQLIDADLVDESYNRSPGVGGNEISEGIEYNENGRAVAYHIFKRHPADNVAGSRDRVRVDATEIIHLFVPMRPGQRRGVTWFAPVLASVKMLDGYEEAEMVAARIAASKMGWIVNKSAEAIAAYEPPKPGETDEPKVMNVSPGSIGELAPGQEFQGFDPTHPNGAFKEFTSTILRGIARGLGVSYHTLTGDLTGANYSSLRAGLLPERDHWRKLQRWLSVRLHRRIYREWIGQALLTGALSLDGRVGSNYFAVDWKPRGWKWVDPENDLNALEMEIALGINSRTRACAERGADFEEIIDELRMEAEYAKAEGVDVEGIAKTRAQKSESRPKSGEDRADARAHLSVVAMAGGM